MEVPLNYRDIPPDLYLDRGPPAPGAHQPQCQGVVVIQHVPEGMTRGEALYAGLLSARFARCRRQVVKQDPTRTYCSQHFPDWVRPEKREPPEPSTTDLLLEAENQRQHLIAERESQLGPLGNVAWRLLQANRDSEQLERELRAEATKVDAAKIAWRDREIARWSEEIALLEEELLEEVRGRSRR